MSTLSDEALAARIPHAPEAEANALWEELAGRHELLLRAIARRAGAENPGDLIADLYRRLKGEDGRWAKLRNFVSETGTPFRNWLAVVACRTARRPQRRRADVPLGSDESAEDRELAAATTRVALLEYIGRLRHVECRVLLRRRYWNGETYEEIAQGTGRSAAALRQTHRRNLKELAALMKEAGDGA